MRPKISFLVIAAIAVLAACHGNQSFTPLAQQQQPFVRPEGARLPFNPSGINPRAAGQCPDGSAVPEYKPAQGPFIIFIANGKVKHNDFKSASSPLTLWVEVKIKKASKPTPPPTTPPSGKPSTAPSPTPPPMDQPVYLYLGKYALAKAKQMGCAFLFATQSGKAFTGSKYGGLSFGDPLITYPKYYKETVIASGPLSENLGKLSATGGKGSATLKLKNGTTFDTARVTLTSRLAEP